jgi:formamidopyrimidine-DNA glycosylase
MPELPDVEIFNRLVVENCRGRAIRQAAVNDPGILEGISPEALERRLKGQRIRSSVRHGKHLFIRLGEAGALAMHFGTNGSLQLVSRAAAEPPYTQLQLHFEGGDRLAYVNPRRLGRVSLCESPEAFAARSRLGPDALDAAFDLQAFTAILGGSKRDIKSVLMDQKLMAGIGNIYSDEILFQARLYPGTPAADLTGESASRLFRAMRDTLETAIRCGAGSEQTAERLPKDFLLVHRHQGGHCPRCAAPLATVKRAGRTSYYCRQCQPS